MGIDGLLEDLRAAGQGRSSMGPGNDPGDPEVHGETHHQSRNSQDLWRSALAPAPKRRPVPTLLLTKHVQVSIARPLREGHLLAGTATLGLLLCNSSSLVGTGPGALWYPAWTFLMCHTYSLWWCLLVWIKMKEDLIAILLCMTRGSQKKNISSAETLENVSPRVSVCSSQVIKLLKACIKAPITCQGHLHEINNGCPSIFSDHLSSGRFIKSNSHGD